MHIENTGKTTEYGKFLYINNTLYCVLFLQIFLQCFKLLIGHYVHALSRIGCNAKRYEYNMEKNVECSSNTFSLIMQRHVLHFYL